MLGNQSQIHKTKNKGFEEQTADLSFKKPETVLWTIAKILLLLAYMATSGGHFSRPSGMGRYWSYSG